MERIEINRMGSITAPVEIYRKNDRQRRMVLASPSHAQDVHSGWVNKLYHEGEDSKVLRDFRSETPGETYTPAPRPAVDDCTHKFRRVGYINKRGEQNPLTTVTCDNPVMYECRFCLTSYSGNCGSRVETDCAKCEARYRNNVRCKARMPLLIAKPDTPIFITLTAPGTQRHCLRHLHKGKPSLRCDWEAFDEGRSPECVECPCSENSIEHHDDMAVFNSRCSRMFNDFLTEIRRSIPGFEGVQYFRAIEPQKRGALHVHAILILNRAVKIDAEVRATMTAIALRLGFGHQLDVKRLPSDEVEKIKTARYVAKYVSKSDGHGRIPFWDEAITYEVVEGSMMMTTVPRRRPNTWSSSRKWGMSMKKLETQQMFFRRGFKEEASNMLEEALQPLRDFQSVDIILSEEDKIIPDLNYSLLIA